MILLSTVVSTTLRFKRISLSKYTFGYLWYWVSSSGFKGLHNEVKPSAVLTACFQTAAQMIASTKSRHTRENKQYQQSRTAT